MIEKNDTAGTVVMEITIQAPVDRVWQALTDVDQMREWYFDLKEFKPAVGYEFQFSVEHEGNTYDHRCKVVEVISQKKLAYTWRYEGQPGESIVTFELFPEADRTRLRLRHEGLETFPKLPAYKRENFRDDWTSLLDSSLKNYLEKIKS
jgi:uncharacterized protein YndB with AHSA1/START domain